MTDDDTIVGRKRVAHAASRSVRTVSRWVKAGILPAEKCGPHQNNLLVVRAADLARIERVSSGRDGGAQ